MAINDFYAERMAKLGVPFIDTRPVASDAQGNFVTYLNDPEVGQAHPDPRGGRRAYVDDRLFWITRGLAGRIRNYADAARSVAEAPPPPGSGESAK